jgi:hypothetical protein
MSEPFVTDEKPVERALREILAPLDRQLARVTAFLPLGLVTIVPGVFFVFWLIIDLTGRRSLVLAGGAFCALVAIYLAWEIAVARMARWRFDHRFPSGTPQRSAALHMLFEMESPSKAEDKLRVALASSSADRIVRRRPASDAPVAWTTPLNDDTTPQAAIGNGDTTTQPAIGSTPTPRPGGYYDYIPLEPRHSDSDRPGERKV